jgi:hypothetical protein
MPSDRFFVSENGGLEPLAVTIEQTEKLTSESRSQVYNRIGRGEYTAIKSGRRTLVLFESIKRRIASLPRANIKPPPPRPPRALPGAPGRGRNPEPAAASPAPINRRPPG